jgi:hypothetical protein
MLPPYSLLIYLPCIYVHDWNFDPDDRGSIFLENVCIPPENYVKYPEKHEK